MIFEQLSDRDRYFASTGDFVIDVFHGEGTISIVLISQVAEFTFASGTNLDNLAVFLGEVRADVIARGYNWSGN